MLPTARYPCGDTVSSHVGSAAAPIAPGNQPHATGDSKQTSRTGTGESTRWGEGKSAHEAHPRAVPTPYRLSVASIVGRPNLSLLSSSRYDTTYPAPSIMIPIRKQYITARSG